MKRLLSFMVCVMFVVTECVTSNLPLQTRGARSTHMYAMLVPEDKRLKGIKPGEEKGKTINKK